MGVSQEVADRVVTAGAAYWNQRFALAGSRERIEQFVDVVGHANEFSPYQWSQLTALALEFQPDCIIEIGNGWGSSTCAFLDAANQLGPQSCRVISLDNRTATDHLAWKDAISPLVPSGWFDPLEPHVARFDQFDYEAYVSGAQRVLVFWDAAGFDVAECVLGQLLPLIADRPHIVAMHDMSDGQFQGPEHMLYGDRPLWKGQGSGGRLRLGPIDTAVDQALAIVDFATRNGVDLTSADESFHFEIALDEERRAEMQNLLGERLFSLQGHWYWFTLNDCPGPCTFPRNPRLAAAETQPLIASSPNEAYRAAYRSWNRAPQFEDVRSDRMSPPATAYWSQRGAVQDSRPRLQALFDALGPAEGISVCQLSQWLAVCIEFSPDLILEVGRGKGHATCALTEAAHRIGASRCRVVSVCHTPAWEPNCPPEIAGIVPQDWFSALTTLGGSLLEVDYASIMSEARRVLMFWGAESYVAAECVLGEILPLAAQKPHVVVLPQLADARYEGPDRGDYSGRSLWRGTNAVGSRIRLGRIDSATEQAVAVVDFASRNEVMLYSADESIQGELTSDAGRLTELREQYGYNIESMHAPWFWFTLNGIEKAPTFPKFEKPRPKPQPEPRPEPEQKIEPRPEAKPERKKEASPAPAPPKPMGFASASLWNQRLLLAACRDRLRALHQAVGHVSDLSFDQLTELTAVALEYKPDLILELGRNKGNSTCAFTEAANQLGANRCRVVSLCNSESWDKVRPPAIASVVPDAWFAPLRTCSGNILDFDYESLLAGANRVLVFWDAHGFEVAECVLGRILPLLAERQHLVIMHDLSDARYIPADSANYGDNPLWRGRMIPGARVRLGNIDSSVEQAVAIVDFTGRNKLTLHSADEDIQVDIVENSYKLREMNDVLQVEAFSPQAHWYYFTLNEHPGPYSFPKPLQRSGLQSYFGKEGWQHRVLRSVRTAAARLLSK